MRVEEARPGDADDDDHQDQRDDDAGLLRQPEAAAGHGSDGAAVSVMAWSRFAYAAGISPVLMTWRSVWSSTPESSPAMRPW